MIISCSDEVCSQMLEMYRVAGCHHVLWYTRRILSCPAATRVIGQHPCSSVKRKMHG